MSRYNTYNTFRRSRQFKEAPSFNKFMEAQRFRTFPEIQRERLQLRRQPPNFISDYNDPHEINSLADALLNSSAKRKKYGDWAAPTAKEWLTRPVSSAFKKLAGTATAYFHGVTWERQVKPILHGEWGASGLNLLMDLGQTMDIVANPVKATVLSAVRGENWWDNFKSSVGLFGEGRKNFNYDTGFIGGDIALEIISDPLNWATMGVSGLTRGMLNKSNKVAVRGINKQLTAQGHTLIKAPTMQAVEEATARMAQKYGPRVAANYKRNQLKIIQNAASESYQIASLNRLAKRSTRAYKANLKLQPGAKAQTMGDAASALVNPRYLKHRHVPFSDEAMQAFGEVMLTADGMLKHSLTETTARVVHSLHKVQNVAMDINKVLFKGVLTSNPVGLGAIAGSKLLKPHIKSLLDLIHSKRVAKFKPYIAPDKEYISLGCIDEVWKTMAKEQAEVAQISHIAWAIGGPSGRNSKQFQTMVMHSLKSTKRDVQKIITQHAKNPDALRKALDDYVARVHFLPDGSTLDWETLINHLHKINEKADGFFDTALASFSYIENMMSQYKVFEKHIDAMSALRGLSNIMTDGEFLTFARNKIIVNDFKQLIDTLEQVLSTQARTKTTKISLNTFYNNLDKKIDTYFRKVTQVHPIMSDIKQDIHKILAESRSRVSSVTTVNEAITKLKQEAVTVVNAISELDINYKTLIDNKITELNNTIQGNIFYKGIDHVKSTDVHATVSGNPEAMSDAIFTKKITKTAPTTTPTARDIQTDLEIVTSRLEDVFDGLPIEGDAFNNLADSFRTVFERAGISFSDSAYRELGDNITNYINASNDFVKKYSKFADIKSSEALLKDYEILVSYAKQVQENLKKTSYGIAKRLEQGHLVLKDETLAKTIIKERQQLARMKKRLQDIDGPGVRHTSESAQEVKTIKEKIKLQEQELAQHAKQLKGPQEAHELIQDLEATFQDIVNSPSGLQEYYDFYAGKVYYQLQDEKIATLFSILQDPEIRKLLHAAEGVEHSPFLQKVYNIINNPDQMAKLTELNPERAITLTEFYKHIESFSHVYDFLNDILGDPGLELIAQGYNQQALKGAILSTLQNHAIASPKRLLEQGDWFINKFINTVEDHVNFRHFHRKLSIDWFRENDDAIKEFIKNNDAAKKAHGATSDSLVTREVIINKKLEIPNADDYYDIVFDIETNSANTHVAEITQYGSVGFESGEVIPELNYSVDVTFAPQSPALKKVYDISPDDFVGQYMSGKNLSQEEGILKYYLGLRALEEQAQKPVRILAHNGSDFDMPVLVEHFKRHKQAIHDWIDVASEGDVVLAASRKQEFHTWLEAFEKRAVDTLSLLREQQGYVRLTPHQRNIIETKLQLYLQHAHERGLDYVMQPVGRYLHSEIKEVYEILLKHGEGSPALESEVRELINNLSKSLTDIKESNIKQQGVYFDKEAFANGIRARDGNIVYNPTAFLNADLHFPRFGFKTAVNDSLIGSFFDLSKLGKGNEQYAKYINSHAKRMARRYDRIKNTGPLAFNSKAIYEVADVVQNVRPELLYHNGIATFRNHLKIDPNDVLTTWVNLEEMFFLIKKHPEKLETLTTLLRERGVAYQEVLSLLNDPSSLEFSSSLVEYAYSRYTMDGLEKLFKKGLKEGQEIESYAEELARIKAMQTEFDDLVELIREVDKTNDLYARNHLYRKRMDTLMRKAQTLLKEPFMDLQLFAEGKKSIASRLEYIERANEYFKSVNRTQIQNKLVMNVEDLRGNILTSPLRTVTFGLDGIHADPELFKTFEFFMSVEHQAKLASVGIETRIINDRVYIVLADPNVRYDRVTETWRLGKGKHAQELQYKAGEFNFKIEGDDETAKFITKNVEDMRHGLRETVDIDLQDTFGDMMSEQAVRDMYAALPEEIKAMLPPVEVLFDARYNDFSRPFINTFNLGTIDERKVFNPFATDDYSKAIVSTARQEITEVQTRASVIDFLLDPEDGMTLFHPHSVLSDYSTEEIVGALDRMPHMKLVALVEDAKIGCKVIEVRPSAKVIEAFKAQGIEMKILPYQIYSQVHKTLNKYPSGPILRMWEDIVRYFKMGVLNSPGVVFRNAIDTPMKTMLRIGATDTATTSVQAMDLIKRYHQVVEDIINSHPMKRWDPATYMRYFIDNPTATLDRQTFDFITVFLNEGPSAGMVYDIMRNQRHGKIYDRLRPDEAFDEWHKKYFAGETLPEQLKNTSFRMLEKISLPYQYVEQVNRLGMYLHYSKMGHLTTSEIYYKIARTHFDYALKSRAEKLIELFIPFYSFTKKNLAFWIEIMTENPQVAGILRDVMAPVWRFQDTDPDELRRNRSLAHRIISGQMPVFKDSALVLKTNPSYQDVLSMFTQPQHAIQNRLIPMMTAPVQAVNRRDPRQLVNAVPLAGAPAQRGFMAERNIRRVLDDPVTSPGRKAVQLPFSAMSSVFNVTHLYRTTSTNQRAYLDRSGRVPRYRTNTYPRLYTKTGMSRLRFHGTPVSPQTLKYRIAEQQRYFR